MKLPVVIRIFKNGHLESVKQFSDSQIAIGQAESAQLHLEGNDIAPLHALIEERDTGYYISDLGSQTGTMISGQRVLDESIESGQSIEIGQYRLDFYIGIPKPSTPPQTVSLGEPLTQHLDSAVPFPSSPKSQRADDSLTNSAPPQKPSEEELRLPSYLQGGNSEKGDRIPDLVPEGLDDRKTTERPKVDEKSSVVTEIHRSWSETTPRVNRSVVTVNRTGTFAPPSEVRNLNEIIKPGKGTVIEVIVAWKERILSSNHFSERGMVRIGSSPENEIILPYLGGTISHSLVRIDSLATVCVTGDMSGELITESGNQSFSELIRQNRLVRNNVGFEIHLEQGEMLRVGIGGDLINIYVRYVAEAPKPIVAPLLDLSTSEVTGVILAAVVALTFGLYMMIYAPKKLDDETLLEEPLRKAVVVFNPPRPAPVVEATEPKVVPTPEKKIVKVVEKKTTPAPKPNPKANQSQGTTAQSKSQPSEKKDPGKAAEAKPNPNKTNKKVLTSARQGGAINTGKSGASPSSEKVDVSKVGLLGTFGSRGTQSKLDKAYSGGGELSGLADSATGFAGQAEDREGDVLGSKLKSAGAGGKGTATVGIAGVGTSGKGSGSFGYGSGGLGNKTRVEVQVGGQEAEFPGSMDREAIRRVILANKRVIRNCYEMALARSPDLYGKLVIQWDIEERGRVANAKVVSNTLGNSSVANCLIQRLKTWRFPDPPPDQVGRVTYPFVFASQ